MSLIVTILNVGMVINIVIIWLKAWSFSFIIAFPIIVIISPLVHKLTKSVLKEEDTHIKKEEN